MKTHIILTTVLAALFGAPAGFRTANAAAEASVPTAATEADNSTLGLLCKGAGVAIEDVRWRVASGLDPKQAVDAALAQKQASEGSKKGGK